jgi:hypothetical protein
MAIGPKSRDLLAKGGPDIRRTKATLKSGALRKRNDMLRPIGLIIMIKSVNA